MVIRVDQYNFEILYPYLVPTEILFYECRITFEKNSTFNSFGQLGEKSHMTF